MNMHEEWTMASEGNIRYLQYILLLGEGSSLVLKGVVNREVRIKQSTLEAVLSDNKCSLRNRIKDNVQLDRLFPHNGPINDDLDTWDIALLSKVILHLFGRTLRSVEKSSVRVLKDMRNELIAHASSMSLEDDEFQSLWTELSNCLTTLASGLSQDIQDKCTELVNQLCKGLEDPESARKKIEKFAQQDEYFRKALELIVDKLGSSLGVVAEKIEEGFIVIQEEMVRNKDAIESTIRSTSGSIHEHVERKSDEVKEAFELKAEKVKAEVKDALNEMCETAVKSTSRLDEGMGDASRRLENVQNEVVGMQDTLGAVGEKIDDAAQVISKDMKEVVHDIGMMNSSVQGMDTKLASMCELMKRLLNEGRDFRSPQVVDAKIDVEGPTDEITSEAEEHLLKEFERAKASALAKAKRAKQSNDPRAIEELGTVVKQFLERIESIEDVQTDDIQIRCIVISVRCSSGAAMLELIHTLRSDAVREHVDDIANVLTSHYGGQFKLTAGVVPESVQKAIDHLSSDTEVPMRRSINLPIRCNTLTGLAQLCQILTADETLSCFEDISAALSRKMGRKVTVKASLNTEQVKDALANVDTVETEPNEDQVSCLELETSGSGGSRGADLHEAAGYTPARNLRVFKSKNLVNVRLNDDKQVCSIYGCCSLPDGSILLADYCNKKLKRLNSVYEITDHCVLPAKPWDVCYAGGAEAVVSLNNNTVQFVNIDGPLAVIRTVKFAHPCWGIAKSLDRLYIKGGASVLSYNLYGDDKRILHADPSAEHVYQHVKASDDGARLYVTGDADNVTVTVLDKDGKLCGTFADLEQKGSRDVCLDGDGNMYVCSEKCKTVVQVEVEGDMFEKVGDVVKQSDGVNSPWCICFNGDQTSMIIGHLRSDTITVVELSAK